MRRNSPEDENRDSVGAGDRDKDRVRQGRGQDEKRGSGRRDCGRENTGLYQEVEQTALMTFCPAPMQGCSGLG